MESLYKKLKAVSFGRNGENLCRQILRLKGYKILAKNLRTPFGEIDIVARKKQTLCFIEVKSRKNLEDALYALNTHQQKRIVRAAYTFLSLNPCYVGSEIRFDLMAVAPMRRPVHIQNTWDEE